MSDKKYDIRLIERGLSKNSVDPVEIKKYLQSLPDDAEYADFVNVEELTKRKGRSSYSHSGNGATYSTEATRPNFEEDDLS